MIRMTRHASHLAYLARGALAVLVGIALWRLVRAADRYRYAGRHRLVAVATVERDRLDEFIDFLTMPVHTCDPPDAPPRPAFVPALGVARYAHLRRDELDATAERALLLNELGIAPPRTAWLDEWAAAELIGAAT